LADGPAGVRDRACLVGRVNIDRATGEADHRIVDSGTCHQTPNLNFGPVTDCATALGRSSCCLSIPTVVMG
jgi:hypothetical protein